MPFCAYMQAFGYVRKQTGISWCLFLYDIINGLCQGLSITGNQLPETNNFANPLQRYCFFLICARVLKKNMPNIGGFRRERTKKTPTKKKATGFAVFFGNPYYIRGERGKICRYSAGDSKGEKGAFTCGAMPKVPIYRENRKSGDPRNPRNYTMHPA